MWVFIFFLFYVFLFFFTRVIVNHNVVFHLEALTDPQLIGKCTLLMNHGEIYNGNVSIDECVGCIWVTLWLIKPLINFNQKKLPAHYSQNQVCRTEEDEDWRRPIDKRVWLVRRPSYGAHNFPAFPWDQWWDKLPLLRYFLMNLCWMISECLIMNLYWQGDALKWKMVG